MLTRRVLFLAGRLGRRSVGSTSDSRSEEGRRWLATKTSSSPEDEERRKALMAKNLPKRKPVTGVGKVILVASGKGGVGKSTLAVNLAVGTKALFPELQVSLLDADVFGPSLPRMMNLSGEPALTEKNLMIPLQNYGVKCMSLGFLVGESAPVVWRGLMVMSAIEKLVRGVQWDPTDILFVDMPPGTGDTQLSFAQSVQVDGAVIVTTPQQVAVQDAIKGVEMFRKTNVPVLGHVLNMSSYVCASCGAVTKSKHTQSFADKSNTTLLGEIPFDMAITDASDEGTPLLISNPQSSQARSFHEVIKSVHTKITSLSKLEN